jgi:hypothetical protein
MQRIRSEMTRRHTLLCLKNADHAPLLPLDSDSPDLFTASPVANFFIPTDADDEMRATLLSSFMGPGPWSLEANVQLPGRGSILNVSNKNRRSNMLVDHTLRVALRIGRAGAPSRAFRDLVLETPVHIFSVSFTRLSPTFVSEARTSGCVAPRFFLCPSIASHLRTVPHLAFVYPSGRSRRRVYPRRNGDVLLARACYYQPRPEMTTVPGTSGCSPVTRARSEKPRRFTTICQGALPDEVIYRYDDLPRTSID